MAEIHYLISDASKKVDVEAHVLRYWEDELELSIPRNEMGHRYYTEFHVRLFQQVKQLKEKGYQLKAIKAAILKTMEDGSVVPGEVLEEDVLAAIREVGSKEAGEPLLEEQEKVSENPGGKTEREGVSPASEASKTEGSDASGRKTRTDSVISQLTAPEQTGIEALLAGEKMEQFQKVMNHIIGRAMEENSEKLSQDVSYLVHDKLLKEMEYLMRVSDEREEERFKRLDESIRFCQRENQGRMEAAASLTIFPFFRLKKKKFGRNGNKL